MTLSLSLFILSIQCSLSLVVFTLIGRWLTRSYRPNSSTLLILLAIHFFRYLPLSLYMPGQVEGFPETVKNIVALGDFASSLLAIVAALLWRNTSRWAKPAIWIFSVVSTADIIGALGAALSAQVYELPLGANYFTVVVYVPLLMVTQFLIFQFLLKPGRTLL